MLRPIATGGSSVVWEARDERDGRRVAVKRSLATADMARVRREIATLRRLRMPGVVVLLDDGVDEGCYFIVMEYLDASPFPGRMSTGTWSALEGITLSLLAVLDRMHREGVIHRDLKPSNVLVDANARPVIVDFGLASELSSRVSPFAPFDRSSGTPPYMAPEQQNGATHHFSPATDLYAVGVMLREALSTDAPPHVRAVCEGLTNPDPTQRPASAREVIALLRNELTPLAPRETPSDAVVWTLDQLRTLFVGDDRLLHLREDAARTLMEHTGGLGVRVRSTLDWWVLSGYALSVDGGYAITREALDWLTSADPMYGEREEPTGHFDVAERELLCWVSIAWPFATVERLARWTHSDATSTAARVALLVERAQLWRRSDGVLILTNSRALHLDWDADRRCAALREVVDTVPVGTSGRLAHLRRLEGEDGDPCSLRNEVVEQALAEAEIHRRAGHIGRAEEALLDALVPLEGVSGGDACEHVRRLFSALTSLVLSGISPRSKDRLLAELSRRNANDPLLTAITTLVRADLDVLRWESRALEAVRALGAFEDPMLELRRRAVLVAASRRVSTECNAREIEAATLWVERSGDDDARAALPGWLGVLRYAQKRYDDAAQHHETAAQRARYPIDRVRESLNAASAWLEAFDFARADALAREARQGARAMRHAFLEGRAEWVLRCVAYRRAENLPHDHELLESANRVHPELEAMLAVTDAAFAYRAGDPSLCRALSARARAIYENARRPVGPLLMRALEGVVGAKLVAQEQRTIIDALATPEAQALPRLVLQTLALLALGGATNLAHGVDVDVLCADVAREHQALRLEVLSVDECRRALLA